MKSVVVGALIAISLAAPAWAEDIVCKWAGVLKEPDRDLSVVVLVEKSGDGKLSGHLESLSNAGAKIMPAENFVSDGAKFSFTSDKMGGSYSAVWDAAKKAWVGTWTQSGINAALELRRAS